MKLLTLLLLLSCGQVVAQNGVIYNQRDHSGGDFLTTGFGYGDSLYQFEVYDRKCECGITFWKDSSMTIWGDTTKAIRLYINSASRFPKQSDNAKLYAMHRRKLLDLLGWIIKRRMDELEIIKSKH